MTTETLETGVSVITKSQFQTESEKMAGLFLERVKALFAEEFKPAITAYATDDETYYSGVVEKVTVKTSNGATMDIRIQNPKVRD